jgi:hypothetical protein
MSVIIGIDPHKATHTAVAIHRDEQPIAKLQVVADRCQTERLLAWAAPFGCERTWAIESASGLGKLLAQQLVGAGEHVVDVPPTLSARVRLLGSTKAGKNDHNDALSTAIAGLRHCELRSVRVEDHTAVVRLLIDRYDGLVALRTQATCRLHVVLRELIAGGAPRRLSANRAAKLLRGVHAAGPAAVERKRLAVDLLADVRRLDQQIAATRSRITDAVEDSNTNCLSCTASDRSSPPTSWATSATRPASRHRNGSLPTTAPPPSRRPADRANGTGSTHEGTASSTTPCISSRSPRSATTPPAASTSNASWPRASQRKKPCAP